MRHKKTVKKGVKKQVMNKLTTILTTILTALVLPVDVARAGEPAKGATKRLDLGGAVTLEVVFIPPGEFMMGSTPEEKKWATGIEGGATPGTTRGGSQAPCIHRAASRLAAARYATVTERLVTPANLRGGTLSLWGEGRSGVKPAISN
jgi:hypothetical protein